MTTGAQPRVVVLGGGFGGLEAAFALRAALGERVEITLVSEYDRFRFKPNTIYIPFGADPAKFEVPLRKPLAGRDIHFVHGRVRDVDPMSKGVGVEQFEGMEDHTIPYDYLVIATGAKMRLAEVPGLADYAHSVWTVADMLRLRRAFDQLIDDARAGTHRRVLFLVPPHNLWSGPLYELVQMLDTRLRHRQARAAVDLTWATYEATYLQALGPRLHEVVVHEFDRRGINSFAQFEVHEVLRHEVHFKNGAQLPYDLLVSFPPYVAATPFPSLPADDRGFIAADLGTRRVTGHAEIFAVGDTADFPLKQAFLACAQADAAAGQIAADVNGTSSAATFSLTSMYVMEQADTATFAEVPLRLTGEPLQPVDVDEGRWDQYLVGSSPLWRAGKSLLGSYVPRRFSAGHPLHAGPVGAGVDLGVKATTSTLASRAPLPPTPQ